MRHLFLATTLSLAALSAHAMSNVYMNLGVGAVFPTEDSSSTANSSSVSYSPTSIGTSVFTLTNVHWENDYKTGLEANAAIGVYLPKHWRLEGEFIYQNMQRDVDGSYGWQEARTNGAIFDSQPGNPFDEATGIANVYSLMANALYDFKNSSRWTPSVGVGIGVAWMDAQSTSVNGILHIETVDPVLDEVSPTQENSPALSGTAFAWQFKLGLDYALHDNISVNLNYRLFGTTHFEAGDSEIITNPDIDGATAVFHVEGEDIEGLLNNTVYAGLRYQF